MIFAHPHPVEKRFIPIELGSTTLYVPVFPLSEDMSGMCAKYARLASKELFGRHFSISPAWNRRYFDRRVSSEVGASLVPWVSNGTLQPGMILGVFNPRSNFLRTPDACGREAPYTHNALFLGMTDTNEPLLAENVGQLVYVRTEEEQRAAGFIPAEIFSGIL